MLADVTRHDELNWSLSFLSYLHVYQHDIIVQHVNTFVIVITQQQERNIYRVYPNLSILTYLP